MSRDRLTNQLLARCFSPLNTTSFFLYMPKVLFRISDKWKRKSNNDNFPGIYYRWLVIHVSALFKSVRNESDLKSLTVHKVTYLKASLQICSLAL